VVKPRRWGRAKKEGAMNFRVDFLVFSTFSTVRFREFIRKPKVMEVDGSDFSFLFFCDF